MGGHRGRRRWLALSLRSMLVLVVAVALWLGWWVNRARDQQAAVAAVRAYDVDANIEYDNDRREIPSHPAGGIGSAGQSRPWWPPAALVRRLGRDYFRDVISVAFGQGTPGPGTSRRGDILVEVARLRGLLQLALYFPVNDADVGHLAGLRALRRLDLGEDCPGLTDEAMRTLGRLPRLEALEIRNAPITDAGLAHLATLPRLTSLALGEARPFSSGGVGVAIKGEGLAHLPGLAELEIHSEAMMGYGLRHLGALGRLKRLKLRGRSFGDDDLRHLATLTGLESLEIVGSSIDGSGFRHLAGLSKLTYICLEGPNVDDAAVPHLARLPALQGLMLYGTRVTAAGLEGFRAAPRLGQMGLIPAVTGDTKRLKRALPGCNVLNGGNSL